MVLVHTRVGLFGFAACLAASTLYAQPTTGGVVVRVDEPTASHCIDAQKERITLYVRRSNSSGLLYFLM
jgi:hypothetical protein